MKVLSASPSSFSQCCAANCFLGLSNAGSSPALCQQVIPTGMLFQPSISLAFPPQMLSGLSIQSWLWHSWRTGALQLLPVNPILPCPRQQSPPVPSPEPIITKCCCQHLNCKFTAQLNCPVLPTVLIQHFHRHPLTGYLVQINWPEDGAACICLDCFLPKLLTSIDIIF